VHEYAFGLTSTPKAELFCSSKRRKFIGQNKVKICKLQSQNFTIWIRADDAYFEDEKYTL